MLMQHVSIENPYILGDRKDSRAALVRDFVDLKIGTQPKTNRGLR